MEIYLVRHTQVDIPKNTCYGQTNIGLAPTFKEEANRIVAQLTNTKNFICYTSQLTRCKTLASTISANKIETDPRLMELNFGDWELKNWDDIDKNLFDKWQSDIVNWKVPNGESFLELNNRVLQFWEELIQKKENAIIVSHSGVLRVLLSHVLGLPLIYSFRIKISFGGLSKVILNENYIRAEFINR